MALCETGALDSGGGEEEEKEEGDELIQEILDELSWSATTSDGTEVDVRSGLAKDHHGHHGQHGHHERDLQEKWDVDKIVRYCKGNVKCRLLESQAALRAMSEGLRSVVPACALGIFSWYVVRHVRFVLVCAGVCWCVLVCAGVCSFVLVCARLCSFVWLFIRGCVFVLCLNATTTRSKTDTFLVSVWC